MERGHGLALSPDPGATREFDVLFPIIHGTFGEDGTLQGFFEMASIPYVGAGVLGSAVGMDKDVMKRLLRDAGMSIVPYWRLLESDRAAFMGGQAPGLPYPVFVKPANLGSSVGITKVSSISSLVAALDEAFAYDRKVVVEAGLDVREIELSVLGNDDPVASVPGEVQPAGEFYDYRAKYIDDDSKLIIPAELGEDQVREAQDLAIQTFRVLECSGLARVDLFLEKSSGKFFVNEINTLPGFTSISQYPLLWAESGVDGQSLVTRLVDLALERHADRSRRRTSVDVSA
jgi:D-alanine-D-alanine ligase